MEEAQGMRAHVSPGTGRRYPLTLICRVFRVSRSSVYAAQAPPAPARPPGKRGPRTRWSALRWIPPWLRIGRDSDDSSSTLRG